MHSLPDNLVPPAVTVSPALRRFHYHTAVHALAFSITVGSTATCADYMKRVNLAPASVASPNGTNITSLEQPMLAVTAQDESWLEKTIDSILADIPDEVWAQPRTKKLADLNKHL
jgi:hypothetical protein